MKKFFVLTILSSLLLLLGGCSVIKGIKDIASGNDMISLPISQTEGERNLRKLGDNQGYEIIFNYKTYTESFETNDNGEVTSTEPTISKEEGQITVGRKDNVYWMTNNEGEGFAILIGEDYVNYYTYEDGAFVYVSTEDTEDAAEYNEHDIINDATDYLFYGNALDGMLKADGKTTILGRECDTYTIASMINVVGKFASDLDDVSYELSLAVDHEIGLTMKLVFKIKSPGEKNEVEFEVTKFEIGDTVTTPTLPEPTVVEPE